MIVKKKEQFNQGYSEIRKIETVMRKGERVQMEVSNCKKK